MFPKKRNNDAEKFIVNIEEFPWKNFDFSMYDIIIEIIILSTMFVLTKCKIHILTINKSKAFNGIKAIDDKDRNGVLFLPFASAFAQAVGKLFF